MSNLNSLQLLSSYGNDGESSGDDVPGPRVSTKRTYKEEKPLRLPVPACIKNQKEDSTWVDNPCEHNGRVRSFRHERGNWATFVYVPYEAHRGIYQLMKTVINLVPEISLNAMDDFHISLTRTVVLQYHWIHPFMNLIKARISHYGSFVALFGDFGVYCNEERTRTFIGLKIKSGYDTLHSLVADLDKCLSEFQLPQFYKDPCFHMSILWCLGDVERELAAYLPQLNSKLEEIMTEYCDEHWYILTNYLYCKTGNKMFQFPLL